MVRIPVVVSTGSIGVVIPHLNHLSSISLGWARPNGFLGVGFYLKMSRLLGVDHLYLTVDYYCIFRCGTNIS